MSADAIKSTKYLMPLPALAAGVSPDKAIDGMESAQPDVPPPPSMPDPNTPADPTDSISNDMASKRQAKGRASTILTGKRGLGADITTARRSLLGV